GLVPLLCRRRRLGAVRSRGGRRDRRDRGRHHLPGAPPTGWVHGIVVRPRRQRSGLGRSLTEAAIAWLRGRSAGAVLLLATEAGRPVYERLGFVAGERYGSFAWPAISPDLGPPGAGVMTRLMQAADLPPVCAPDPGATR